MTDIQNEVAKIWAQALGQKTVAADGNFFALGGHSLMAVKVIAAVQEKLNLGSELALTDLIDHPTLTEFSAHLQALLAPSEETGSL